MRRCLNLQHWIAASAHLQLLDQRNLILAWRPAFALLTRTSLLHVLWPPQILMRRTLVELCSISLLQARLVLLRSKALLKHSPCNVYLALHAPNASIKWAV